MRIANLFQARYLRAKKKMLTREEIAEIVQYCKEKQLVRGNDSFPEPVLTDRKTGKGRRSGQESIPMSIEMRTQTGAVLRIRGNLDAAMIQAIIQASSSHV